MNEVERMINSGLNPNLNIDGLIEKLVSLRDDLELARQRMETADRGINDLLADNQITQSSTLKEAIERLKTADASATQEYVSSKLARERSAQADQIHSETTQRTTLEKKLQAARAKLQSVMQRREDSR